MKELKPTKAENIIIKEKYKGLKNLVLICEAMDEFAEAYHKQKENIDLYDNMQYYLEFCQRNGYVTPKEWLSKHKHF
jgi:hypothetical protein